MEQSERHWCEKFISDPSRDPKDNHKLQKYRGPYMGYIKLCQKHKYDVDHLLPPTISTIAKPISIQRSISIQKPTLILPTPKFIINSSRSLIKPTSNLLPIPKPQVNQTLSTIHQKPTQLLKSETIPKFDIITNLNMIPKLTTKSIDIGYLSVLPDELLDTVLMELACKEIIRLCNLSDRINNVCEINNIIERRKYKGFPRKTGHCYAFDVYHFIFTGKEIGVLPEDYEDENDIHEYNANELMEEFDYSEKALNIILDRLNQLNYDLVRGDLICTESLDNYRNSGVYIFDGCKIIDLDRETIDDYGALPPEFHVINDGVPITYWINFGNEYYTKGVDHNNIVWFDSSPVKDQLMNNIKIEGDELYTTFIFNNVEYKILYSDEHSEIQDINKRINNFKKDLVRNHSVLDLNTEEYYDINFEHVLTLNTTQIT